MRRFDLRLDRHWVQPLQGFLFAILLLGILLRTFQFPNIPPGLFVDEAGAGYETFSLLHTGADSCGIPRPAYFIRWGSGQSVLYSYLSMPIVAVLGLSRFSIRLLSWFSGILTLPLLYVAPSHRRQGVGARLLAAAENWLYYCPVYVGSHAQPCYGTVEGPRAACFFSSERMGVSAHDADLLAFLAHRGYRVVDPGDVSLRLALSPRPVPSAPDLAGLGLHLLTVDEQHPFAGRDPAGRAELSLWGKNDGDPYAGLVLADADEVAHGHIAWYPIQQADAAGLVSFWVAPALRGRGLGRYLLDRSLSEMSRKNAFHRVYDKVDVHTHLVHHSRASELYRSRGFVVDTIWVNLVKT